MPLAPGHRFGPYEILAPLGAGGMGEVYRARDTRLGREVAIKVLPQAVGADPQRLARFEREAQLLAALNHPNIAAIHGVEEADGVLALVLELVDGPTLEERLRAGPLPLDEALPIARQIAEAIEAAHESGIVHRDLKPANIKLTADGRVKVLDFGLAKALAGDASSPSDASMSPTLTAAATAAGVILGTAAYMSPEQAKGKGVDRRSDIWNFGIVVLEMLSGRRAFEGETITEVLASIMKDPVPFERLPSETPLALRALLSRCLERDPKRRLQAIGEARIALEELAGSGRSSLAPGPVPGTGASGVALGGSGLSSSGVLRDPSSVGAAIDASPQRRRAVIFPWAIAALSLAALAVVLLRGSREAAVSGPGPSVRKFAIATGGFDLPGRNMALVSPDGRRIAYLHDSGLWIRDLSSLESRLVVSAKGRPPEETPSGQSWSPDSLQIAYAAAGRLWKVPAEGGSPTVVCSVGDGFLGGTWLPDDRLVYTIPRGDMFEVSVRGGDPKVLLARDAANDVDFHEPWALPGGRGIVYALHRKEGVDTIELFADGKRKQLLRIPVSDSNSAQVVNLVSYASSGHLLFQREQGNRGVWAVPFSLADLEVTGEPFLVAAYGSAPSASDDGTLLYVPGHEETPRRLVWVNRAGGVEEALGEAQRGLSAPALATDGTTVAYAADDNSAGEIWVLNLASGTRTRLTFTPADEGGPRWIPGQNRVSFVSAQEGRYLVSARAADGSGDAATLANDAAAPEFTPDGKWIVFQGRSDARNGLMRRLTDGTGDAEMFLPGSGSNLYNPALSPDGRYVAYFSWERGTPTTYIRPFPSGEGKWELPNSWESRVLWLRDRILYTVDRPEPALMEIPASLAGTLSLGTPRKLFDLGPNRLSVSQEGFSATSDAKRILMVQDMGAKEAPDEVVVVENWLQEFQKHAAGR